MHLNTHKCSSQRKKKYFETNSKHFEKGTDAKEKNIEGSRIEKL